MSKNAVEEIRRLYNETTPGSIHRDIARAIALLKTLPTEADRERVAVYMDGLSQMRSEWAVQKQEKGRPTRARGKPGRR